MDLDVRKIYSKLDSFNNIEGISEIKQDMELLNTKINEYRGIAALNNIKMPVVSLEMDSLNNTICEKYNTSIKDINVPVRPYTIKTFGQIDDSQTRKLEDSISKLGRLAVKKICDSMNIECSSAVLNGSNQDVVNYFNQKVVDKTIEEEVSDKVSFRFDF